MTVTDRAVLTEAEFADAVGLKPGYIAALRRLGKVPHCKIGKYVRYRVSDIQGFLDYHQRQPVRPVAGIFERYERKA